MDTKNRKRAHPKSATDTLRSVKGTKQLREQLKPTFTKKLFCVLSHLFGSECSQNADVGADSFIKSAKSIGAENSSQNHRKDDKPNSKTTKNSGKQHETELLQAIQQQWTLLNSENASRPKKSLFWAYFCWLFGGVFGLHLFYLERDAHAFLTGSTLGGYGLGWLADITKIPRYVRDCNNDPRFLEELIFKMRKNRKPPFSTSRFISAVMVGYLWGQLIFLAIPQDELYGINWNTYLHWFIPLGVALGVWVVGNIGREQGKPWLTILVSYVSYLSRWYFYDDSVWLSIVMFSAAFTFDTWSKEWRRTPNKKKPLWKRLTTLGLCTILYLSLWSSYIYFNGKITDSNGDEIPVHEAIHHFFTSSWWTDFKQSLYDIYLYAQHHGWYEIWKQVIDLSDPQGEQNAYKVLGVSPTASQQEITSRWRTLSRENHPDKCKDPDKLRDAQEKFMEIQQAYDILSNIKSKRRRKNKKSVKEDEHEL